MHPLCRYFSGRAQLWATFNEGNVQAFCGYVYSSFPPGRIGRFTEDGRYLMHIFQAHTAAYDALKAMPGWSYGGDGASASRWHGCKALSAAAQNGGMRKAFQACHGLTQPCASP